MAFAIDNNLINKNPDCSTSYVVAVAADDAPLLINGCYPRGLRVISGGELVLWNHLCEEVHLGTVADGYELTGVVIYGISTSSTASSFIAFS